MKELVRKTPIAVVNTGGRCRQVGSYSTGSLSSVLCRDQILHQFTDSRVSGIRNDCFFH